ncbi:MAG: NAD-dependent epimerase/dehydratase family protein [Lachnospiraceae bacterium]|nr:NAD-dependent epimerase/dehydratase family protein [Lachnospiraceae bacterium]
MKKILITGANSYIGTSFEKWAMENCKDFQIETQDMLGEEWKKADFSGYDTIFHVAGIAHADVGKVSEEGKKLYYKVNADLTIECAKKAKDEGVKQFIFMSSIIVYGESAGIGKMRVITRETPLSPANFYGDSKVKAEEGLQKLEDESFKVVILRPPMIYGKGSKGNYPLLAKMAKKLPIFPDIKNQRSMLYVENLCKFISLMIKHEERGVFFPQNAEYVQTSVMVREIANVARKRIIITKWLNGVIWVLGKIPGKSSLLVNKAFGNLVYDQSLRGEYERQCIVCDFRESIAKTEE